MKNVIKKMLIKIFSLISIRNNYILCNNFNGNGYGENPKYVVDKLKSDKSFKIYWMVSKNNNSELPENVHKLVIGTLKYFYIIATSKIWISNVRLPEYFIKRKKQFYIQTWHGTIGIKKIEYDVLSTLPDIYIRQMENDNKMIDLMISGSSFFTKLCKNSFKYCGNVLECGEPKYDYYFNNKSKNQKNELKKYLNIKEENILLYMPTFRNDYSIKPYDLELDKIKGILEFKYGCSFKVLCKMHPNIQNKDKIINCSDYILVDDYNDNQKLIDSSDIIITDYSSIMFEAMAAKKPIILYVKDINNYLKYERDFYFNLDKLPFPYFKSSEKLIKYLKNNDIYNIVNKYHSFLLKQGLNEEGKSSEKIAKFIYEKCFNLNLK